MKHYFNKEKKKIEKHGLLNVYLVFLLKWGGGFKTRREDMNLPFSVANPFSRGTTAWYPKQSREKTPSNL